MMNLQISEGQTQVTQDKIKIKETQISIDTKKGAIIEIYGSIQFQPSTTIDEEDTKYEDLLKEFQITQQTIARQEAQLKALSGGTISGYNNFTSAKIKSDNTDYYGDFLFLKHSNINSIYATQAFLNLEDTAT